jgi:hypothetical protein
MTWNWNGRNSLGAVVASGTYLVRLTSSTPGGATKTIVRTITVIDNSLGLVDPAPLIGPNPLPASANSVTIVYKPQPGTWGYARIYNAAGELVSRGADPQGVGSFNLPSSNLAGGVYAVEFELRGGADGVSYRKLLKLGVTR